MKRIAIVVAVLSLLLNVSAIAQTPVHNHDAKTDTAAPAPAGIVDAKNKTCPITGEPVNGKDFVVYKNIRYGLCCAGCDKMFLKEPEKYIQKLREKGEIK